MMQLLGTRGFPVTLAIMTIALASFTAVRIRRDPPVPPESRGSFVAVDQNSPGEIVMPARESVTAAATDAATDSVIGDATEARPGSAPPAGSEGAADDMTGRRDTSPGARAPSSATHDVSDALILDSVDRRRL
jgi:hypothetical protein